MAKIIVVTNFSDSSRNALDYACAMLHHTQSSILLLNIFSFPGSISYDGVALAGISETLTDDEMRLQREYEWARVNYPDISIQSEMVSGGAFMEELHAKALEEGAVMIVMGADGNFSDLLSWGVNIIDSFADLQTPVLVIPERVRYRPIQNIAFACDYCRKNQQIPSSMIRRIIQFTKATLHVIHVATPTEVNNELTIERKNLLQQNLADLSPLYYEPVYNDVVSAINNFVEEKNINLLIVIPEKHGVWHHVFQQSHSKALVSLNQIPLLSLHKEGAFL